MFKAYIKFVVFCSIFEFSFTSGQCIEKGQNKSLHESYDICFNDRKHLITMEELESLQNKPDGEIHISAHRLFGNKDKWLGPLKISNLQRSTEDDEYSYLTWNNLTFNAVPKNHLADIWCCEKNNIEIYPERNSMMEAFKIDNWHDSLTEIKKYNKYSDTPTEYINNAIIADCLSRCVKNIRCKVAYHAESVNLCVLKLHIDAPLGPGDTQFASDHIRYSFST